MNLRMQKGIHTNVNTIIRKCFLIRKLDRVDPHLVDTKFRGGADTSECQKLVKRFFSRDYVRLLEKLRKSPDWKDLETDVDDLLVGMTEVLIVTYSICMLHINF